MLGGQPQEARYRRDRLIPFYGPAPEGAGLVVEAPGHPDAEPVGGALMLPADHRFEIVHVLDDPDQGFRLHQVEGDMAAHLLSLGDDALGDVPDHRGLHEAGLGAVPVQALLGQGEIVRVLGQSVLLVQGEKSVLWGVWTFGGPSERCPCLLSMAYGICSLFNQVPPLRGRRRGFDWRAAGDGEVGAWRSPMCRNQMVCGAKATNHEHGRRLNLQPEVTEGLPGLSEREQPILPLLLGRWGCNSFRNFKRNH